MHDADAGEHPGSTLSFTSMKTHPRPTVIAACAAVLVGLSGCADSDAEPATEVLAVEDVLTEVPDVTVDSSGTFATLSVTTDLEMACAVVYGQTEDLGEGIATDDDMGGGAHTDHQAVMRDLEPDTVYHYRLQGSGSDGRLYQGDLATFRTPPAGPSDAPGPNAALDARVKDVSSEFSASFAAGNAIDGDPGTEWSTDGDGDDASITLDLGQAADIIGVGYRSRSMSDGTAIVETYQVTIDGTTYGPFPAGTGLVVSETSARGQILTFEAVTTSGGNTGAAEIEVYTDPAG
jgi:hypothetical protein